MASPPPVALITPEIPQAAPLTAHLGTTEDLSPHRLQPTQSYIASSVVSSGSPVPTFADNLGGSFTQVPPSRAPVPTFADSLGGSFVQALDETWPSSPPSSSAHLLMPSRSYIAEAAPPRLPAAAPTSATLSAQQQQQPMWEMLAGSGVQVTRREEAAQGGREGGEDEQADNLAAWAGFFDDEEPEAETLPSDLDLQALSEQQLMQMLEERTRAVASLQEEIAQTQRHPGNFEARLARLEQIFGRVRPSDIIEVRAPALLQISEALGQAHLIDRANIAQQSEPTPGNKASTQKKGRFILGRDYLPLDQMQIASEEAAQELKTSHHHPMVKGMHYAGHVAAEMQDIDTRVVLAGGVEDQRAVDWNGSGYWLHHLAETGGDHIDAAAVSRATAAEDFVASVRGPDGEAVDWLGRMKRGWPVPKPHPKESWQPPSWMY